MRFVAALAPPPPLAAGAQGAFTSLHPEAAIPDPPARIDQHAYTDLVIGMQERLNALGFDAGPPNGDFGTKTQAALAQFQLSHALPASGQLDDQTLAALGLSRNAASAGGTAAPQAETTPQPQEPVQPPDAPVNRPEEPAPKPGAS
jgi:peptidoglycan hydrolase-like protein with peptidoglycan-binding domain